MPIPELRRENSRLFRGCAAGLAERTAVVDIAVLGGVRLDAAAEARIRAAVCALSPEEPLYGVAGS
ncbi:MAG: hypothetical protein WD228_10975, partial [Mycobacterium sp.]